MKQQQHTQACRLNNVTSVESTSAIFKRNFYVKFGRHRDLSHIWLFQEVIA